MSVDNCRLWLIDISKPKHYICIHLVPEVEPTVYNSFNLLQVAIYKSIANMFNFVFLYVFNNNKFGYSKNIIYKD